MTHAGKTMVKHTETISNNTSVTDCKKVYKENLSPARDGHNKPSNAATDDQDALPALSKRYGNIFSAHYQKDNPSDIASVEPNRTGSICELSDSNISHYIGKQESVEPNRIGSICEQPKQPNDLSVIEISNATKSICDNDSYYVPNLSNSTGVDVYDFTDSISRPNPAHSHVTQEAGALPLMQEGIGMLNVNLSGNYPRQNGESSSPDMLAGNYPCQTGCTNRASGNPHHGAEFLTEAHSSRDSLPQSCQQEVNKQDPLARQRTIISAIWPTPSQVAQRLAPDFCQVYETIRQTAQPNYTQARIQVNSGLVLDEWDKALVDYHDRRICEFLRFGWPIGYHKMLPPSSVEDNHPSATQHIDHVRKFIQTEIGHRALLGPFPEPPFQPWTRCSPVMTRPKKDSDQRRVIVDLSFPEGQAVNSGIDIHDYFGQDITYTLPSLGDLVTRLQLCGPGVLVWKADLARAYRQLRVDPLDTPLLGMKVDGMYYVDLCPPFGCRTSSAACQRVSNAVVHLMRKAGFFTLAYLDDYGGCESTIHQANTSFQAFKTLADKLGLKLAPHKCVPPCKDIEWLGYRVDTERMRISVPDTKLVEVLDECKRWTSRKRASKKMIQSLAGRLLFLANCVRAARKFVGRILATLRVMQDNAWTTIKAGFLLDIQWFLNYAKQANGVFYYTPDRPQAHIECDSSLLGGGGLAGQYCYAWKYTKAHVEGFPRYTIWKPLIFWWRITPSPPW